MGPVLLVAALVLALSSAIQALATPSSSSGSGPRSSSIALAVAAVASLWASVVVLATALVTEDLGLAYVVEQTRPDTGWARRLSGLWSGAEGSLLLFAAVTATALLVGRRTGPRWQRAGTGVLTAGLVAAVALGADPFAGTDRPAGSPLPTGGRGMAPILEHGAMFIHPPLLYAGLALALTPALVAARGGDRQPARATAHRLGLIAFAVLGAAQALGASWAYVELGWGGWWAWDPIENVSLVVWLLLAAALHTRALDPENQVGAGLLSAPVLWALCWPAVLAGAALTRTSQRTSVHAFADAAQLSVWLWPLAIVATIGAVLRVGEDRPTVPERAQWPRRAPQAVLGLVALVVAAGTYRPFVSGDGTAGWFYSRTLFPIAVVGVALALILPVARPGGDGRPTRARPSLAVLAGHGGMILILVAAVAGTGSTRSTVRLTEGSTVEVDGHTVTLVELLVDEGERPTVTAVTEIDGRHRLDPSVTLHPDRGLRLPEIPTHSTPWLDTQLILRDVDPVLGAQLTVQFRPFNQLVWWGAGLVTLSAVLALARRGPGAGYSSSRDRLALSSSSIVVG